MTDRAYARARFIGMLGSTFAVAACSGGGTAKLVPTKLNASSNKFSLVRNENVLTLSNAQGELLRSVASPDAPLQILVKGVGAAVRIRTRQSVNDGWKPGEWITYTDGSRAVVRASGHMAYQDPLGHYTVVQDNRDGTISVQNKSVSDGNVRLRGRIWTAPGGLEPAATSRKTRLVTSNCDLDPALCTGDEPIDDGGLVDPSVIFGYYEDPSSNPGWIDDSFFSDPFTYTQACQDAIEVYRLAEAAFLLATAGAIFSTVTGPGALLVYGAWLLANANLGRAKSMVDRACAGQGYNWL